MPANTVHVARPSKWGNPFQINHKRTDPATGELVTVRDAAHAVTLFRAWIKIWLEREPLIMETAIAPLRGKNLACWCALDQPCHADVLLDIANRGAPPHG